MARSFNQVILMGNLTRTTPTGQSVCSFSLALNRSWKNADGEWVEATDYVDVVAWAGLGERVAQYLSKGRPALVNGRIQSRSWEQDGQKRSKVEVIANDVTFLGSPGGGGAPSASDDSNSSDKPTSAKSSAKKKEEDVVIEDIGDEPINLDDIPF
jgi:single-strand DNA-binding protein